MDLRNYYKKGDVVKYITPTGVKDSCIVEIVTISYIKTESGDYLEECDLIFIEMCDFPKELTKTASSESLENDMNSIQSKCMEIYPIGCHFVPAGGYDNGPYILKSDNVTYSIRGNCIWAGLTQGCLYYEGKWAKVIYKDSTSNKQEDPIKAIHKNPSFSGCSASPTTLKKVSYEYVSDYKKQKEIIPISINTRSNLHISIEPKTLADPLIVRVNQFKVKTI